jgi:hypothetical protein
MEGKAGRPEQMLLDAANHLQSAIDMLDSASAPGHIAAHADLALQQLKDLISKAPKINARGPGASDEGYRTARTS